VWRLLLSIPADYNDDYDGWRSPQAARVNDALHTVRQCVLAHIQPGLACADQPPVMLHDAAAHDSAKYAQYSGPMDPTTRDRLSALEELGMDLEELTDYVSEGRELGA
jgi:hypothetical protein